MKKLILFILMGSILGCGKIDADLPGPDEDPEVIKLLVEELEEEANIIESFNEGLPPEGEGFNIGDLIVEPEGFTSLAFNGVDQYLEFDEDLRDYNNYSLSIWFKTNDPNSIQTVFWQGVGDQNGWGAGQHNPAKAEMNVTLNHWSNTDAEVLSVFYGYNESADNSEGSGELLPLSYPVTRNASDGSFSLTGFSTPITTDWHHLVVIISKNGSQVQAQSYLDGILVGTGTGTQVDNSLWNPQFRVGRPGADQRYFSGKLAKFMFFSKELSFEEVQALYEDGL